MLADHLKKLKEEDKAEEIKIIYEGIFVFGLIWSFGGPISESKIPFNNYLRNCASKVKFPDGGLVYDYTFDVMTG